MIRDSQPQPGTGATRRKRILARGVWVSVRDNAKWIGRVEAFLADGRVQVALFTPDGELLLGREAFSRSRLLVREPPGWLVSTRS